jgi:predicted nucleic acid-binding protein
VAVYYFDSSALVKRYAAEVGTVWVRGISSSRANHVIVVSLIGGAEVVAALAKRQRIGSIDSTDAQQAIADFDSHFRGQYSVTPLTRQVVERAMSLATTRALRGYDAVQLATALTVSEELTEAGIARINICLFRCRPEYCGGARRSVGRGSPGASGLSRFNSLIGPILTIEGYFNANEHATTNTDLTIGLWAP